MPYSKNIGRTFFITSILALVLISLNHVDATCRWVCGYSPLGTDGNTCVSDWSACSGCTQGISSDQCGGCLIDPDGTILQPYTATCPNYLCYYPATKSEFDCSTINGCSEDKRLYCDTESECNNPGTPQTCDTTPPGGEPPVIDYGHDCANYHNDCYNCIEHDMSGAGSCGYCTDQQKCIQGDSNGPWHVFTKEECGTWLWDSGNDCSNIPPPAGCSKDSCVNINGEWVSGECRIQRCNCRNCNSQSECCGAWGGCESDGDYRGGTEDYVYKVDKTSTPEECEGNLPSPNDAIEITSCQEINELGDYILVNDISTSSGDCITINADNVVLDCLNRRIEGTNGGDVGINVFSNGNVIRNCHIENFDSSGIRIDCDSKDNLIENNSLLYNTYAIFLGRFVIATTNNIIKDNILRDSELGLVNYGLFTTIENNEICQNTLDIDSTTGSFTGNNNLCDTTRNYHDEGVEEGCEDPCPGSSTTSSIDIPQIGETFQLSFYGQDIEDVGGLVIITGQPIERTIAQRVFNGDEIDITPQLSGPLVTRLISLGPIRISKLVQEVQET